MVKLRELGIFNPTIVTNKSTTYRRIPETGEFVPHSFDNEPAIIYGNGDREFRKNGQLHNDSGPAIQRANGSSEYFLEGKKRTKTQWTNERKPTTPPEIDAPGLQSISPVAYKTITALREAHGNVDRSDITGKPGNYVYSPR